MTAEQMLLATMRAALDETQEQFAQRLDIAPNTIARMERGERGVTRAMQKQVIDATERLFEDAQLLDFQKACNQAHIYLAQRVLERSGNLFAIRTSRVSIQLSIDAKEKMLQVNGFQFWTATITPTKSPRSHPVVEVSEYWHDSKGSHYLSPLPMSCESLRERYKLAFDAYVTNCGDGTSIVLTADVYRF